MIIINSLKRTWNFIVKNKLLFLGLFLLQVLFCSSFFAVQVFIQPKIMQSGGEMIDYLESAEGGLGDDPLLLYRSGKEILSLILLDIAILLGLFFVIGNLLWCLSLPKKFNARYMLNFLYVSLTYLVPYLIVIYFSLKDIIFPSPEKDLVVEAVSLFILIISIVMFYFFFISLSLVHLPYVENFKKTFLIGAMKPHLMLAVYIIGLMLVGLIFGLFVLTVDMNLFLFLLVFIFLIAIYVSVRILIINTVNALEN